MSSNSISAEISRISSHLQIVDTDIIHLENRRDLQKRVIGEFCTIMDSLNYEEHFFHSLLKKNDEFVNTIVVSYRYAQRYSDEYSKKHISAEQEAHKMGVIMDCELRDTINKLECLLEEKHTLSAALHHNQAEYRSAIQRESDELSDCSINKYL